MVNEYHSDGNGHIKILLKPFRLQVFAVIDESDLKIVSGFDWTLFISGSRSHLCYAISLPSRQRMHRLILSADAVLDHINGDGLDNRKCNLRPATRRENLLNRGTPINNTSGYKGVSKASRTTWKAMIQTNGKDIYLGSFKSKEDAAKAYDAAAARLFGEFAKLNFNDGTVRV